MGVSGRERLQFTGRLDAARHVGGIFGSEERALEYLRERYRLREIEHSTTSSTSLRWSCPTRRARRPGAESGDDLAIKRRAAAAGSSPLIPRISRGHRHSLPFASVWITR